MENTEELLTQHFASAVKNHVGRYLSKFNLRLNSERLLASGTRDSHYELKYIGLVGLVFTYYIFDSTIGVGFVKIEDGKFPEKYSFIKKQGFAMAITLSGLIEYKRDERFNDPLPNSTSSIASIKRTLLERQSILRSRLDEVVECYISNIEINCADLLLGNLSYFAPVQERYTRKIKQEYSWYE